MRAPYFWLQLLLLSLFMGSPGVAFAEKIGKPGLYRLQLTNDDPFCRAMEQIINESIGSTGQIRLSEHPSFLNWAIVKGTERSLRDPAPEDILGMVVDIDNDGLPDHVFKGISSIRGYPVDSLFLFSKEKGDALTRSGAAYAKLFEADRKIEFFSHVSWIKRAKEKYGENWERWVPGPLSRLELIRHQNAIYVVGHNPAASRDQSADVYIFQVAPKDEIRDVCMLHRVCPCRGCTDLRGTQADQRVPAPQWCKP